MSKRALILGIGGQDGSYLAELLLAKGYRVYGLYRRSSCDNLWRLRAAGVLNKVYLRVGDLCDPMSMHAALADVLPDEVYNLADQDHVGTSRATPRYNMDVTAGAVASLLEICRTVGPVRVFQACSATMLRPSVDPIGYDHPHDPRSPYAIAKTAAFHLARHYRRDHGLYVATGVFYQHSSPRQSPDYLLPTIARQAMEVARGDRGRIELIGPDALVDVGYAPEYAEAAWRILQQDKADDWDVGTGVGYRVSTLCQTALSHVGSNPNLYTLADPTKTAENRICDVTRPGLPASQTTVAPTVLTYIFDHYFLGMK